MENDRKWVVVRVDGKLAAISQDYGKLAEISACIARKCSGKEKGRHSGTGKSTGRSRRKIGKSLETHLPYSGITAHTASFEDIMLLRQTTGWDDMILFGTDFQKRVWKKLWELAYNPDVNAEYNDTGASNKGKLLSYSDFAELCENRAGVRPVAHAIGLNPIPVIIPCHLVVPKEAIDKINEIQRMAESTIFKGEDLCQASILNDNSIDFGEYALGKELKRKLISMDIAKER